MDLRREIHYRLCVKSENKTSRLEEEEILPNFKVRDFCKSADRRLPEFSLLLYKVCRRNKVSQKEMFDRMLDILMKYHPMRVFSMEEHFGRHYLREKLTEMTVYARKESNEEVVVLNHETVSMIISYLGVSDLLSVVKAFYNQNNSKFQMQETRKRKSYELSE
ncbi:hypothetical protein AVEN_271943-1 [Araneus ventricosus]|uniref:Uncharacterized protein n=1 Tax=Araneus ventricosus TaxID=182803 RepID=A0A4Y2CCH8_ARAVE|nr:hypothetical protein AVEN_271943-1 [Araneus ventricosus]